MNFGVKRAVFADFWKLTVPLADMAAIEVTGVEVDRSVM